jgi:tetratricopeptide (TPR) repeat protein
MTFKSLIAFLCLLSTQITFANDGQSLVVLGNQAMNQGRYRVAQDYYQQALVLEPQNANIYTLLGFCYHKQRQFNNADSIFKISIQMDSLASKVYWYKGMNHIALKEDSTAIVNYKKFIDIEKKSNGRLIEAYKAIGQSYERMLRSDGLYSWQIDDMIYYYELVEQTDPSLMEVPLIQNFIEHVKSKRPANQIGKWKLTE